MLQIHKWIIYASSGNKTIRKTFKLISKEKYEDNFEFRKSGSGLRCYLAVNNKMVPRTQWADFQLKENDALIVIKAACGG